MESPTWSGRERLLKMKKKEGSLTIKLGQVLSLEQGRLKVKGSYT